MANKFSELKCPDCGGEITEEDERCPNCGADLAAAVEQPPLAIQYFAVAQAWYDKGGDMRGALKYCDQAIEQQPEMAEAHNLRGLILDALKKPDEAILSYREAVRLNPFFEEAKANLQDAENERLSRSQAGVWQEAKPGLNWTKIVIGIAGAAFLLALIAGAYFGIKFGLEYLGPKQALILEPDYSLVASDVTAADLQETAQILTERANQLGYPRITFTVSDNGEITAQVPSQVDLQEFFSRISPIGLVEFVDFGDEAMLEGKKVSTDLEHKFLQQVEGTRYHTLMTNDEIQAASVEEDAMGNSAVAFTFTQNGTNLFSAYTSQNVGSYLGIVKDKIVISCPVINVPITDGQGMIQGVFTKQAAEELAAVLQTRPLPIPIRLKESAASE